MISIKINSSNNLSLLNRVWIDIFYICEIIIDLKYKWLSYDLQKKCVF